MSEIFLGLPHHLLGARLREQREDRGLKRKQFCEDAGLTQLTQQRYESGERIPDATYLVQLSERFGFDVSYILFGTRTQANTELSAPEAQMLQRYKELPPPLRAHVDLCCSLAWSSTRIGANNAKQSPYQKIAQEVLARTHFGSTPEDRALVAGAVANVGGEMPPAWGGPEGGQMFTLPELDDLPQQVSEGRMRKPVAASREPAAVVMVVPKRSKSAA